MKKTVSREEFDKIKQELTSPKTFRIATGSMSPFIKEGDLIRVWPLDKTKLKKLDIIVYWQSDRLICHFFYKREHQGSRTVFYAKALNSSELDPPLYEEDILGVVVKPVLPRWKKFIMRFFF